MGVAPCRSFRCPRQWSRGGHDRACFLVWYRLFRVADGERRCLRPQRFHGRAQDAAVRDAVDGQLSWSFDAGHGQRPGPVHGGPGSRPLPGCGRTPWPHEGRGRLHRLHRDGRGWLRSQASYRLRRRRGCWLFEGLRKTTGLLRIGLRTKSLRWARPIRAEARTMWCVRGIPFGRSRRSSVLPYAVSRQPTA